MRIIGGSAGGIVLEAPAKDVRPTTDRVKESLFAILEPLIDLTVVDLFAGSGALGLEALSRGAAAVYLVELQQRQCRLIRSNLERVHKSMGRTAPATVVRGDATRAAALLPDIEPDLILADPPYHPRAGQKGAADFLVDPAFCRWAAGARLVVEQSARAELPVAASAWWQIERRRVYGDTALYFLRPVGAVSEPS